MVADRPQRAGLRRRNHLEVAHARATARAPVDEGLRPIREAVAVQPLEGRPNGLRRTLVHRVPQPAPIGGRADAALLPEHHRAGRVGERAHPLEIPVASERLPALALLGDDPVEHELRRDAGMVEAR